VSVLGGRPGDAQARAAHSSFRHTEEASEGQEDTPVRAGCEGCRWVGGGRPVRRVSPIQGARCGVSQWWCGKKKRGGVGENE